MHSVVLMIVRKCVIFCYIFFFKQKTAYEIVSRDWSSDVCSSDLIKCVKLSPWIKSGWQLSFTHLIWFALEDSMRYYLKPKTVHDRTTL